MYGLPKIHKANCPIRPILSACGTANYKLAKYLVGILNPISKNNFTCKDTFQFVDDIKYEDFSGKFLCSFDVESLFTNIPLKETLDICISKLYSCTENKPSIPSQDLRSLLELAALDCVFTFNNNIYVQCDGVAMGSPLGPILANVFMHKPVIVKIYI